MPNLYTSPSDVNWSSGVKIFIYVNDVTGVFGWLLLLCIYFIVAFGVSYYKKDITQGIGIAGVLTLILAISFRILDLINTVHLSIVIVVAILGLIMLLFGKTKENA